MMLNAKSTPKARGKRLETLRKMAGLTRQQLQVKYGISASTLQTWENGKNRLTERGCHRVLQALRQEGIICDAAWLFHEIGTAPQLHAASTVTEQLLTKAHLTDHQCVIEELLVFRCLHPHSVDLVIPDDGMNPWFQPGDYIAGIPRRDETIQTCIGRDCIVQTAQSDILFRHIKRGSQPNLYHLICINADTHVINTMLCDQTLRFAAPIIWQRRPQPIGEPLKIENLREKEIKKLSLIFHYDYA